MVKGRKAILGVILAAALFAFYLCLQAHMSSYSPAAKEKSWELAVTFFKIGKADAVLIETKDRTVLIDTGEDEDAQEIADYLFSRGKDSVDELILTHFDKDHVGGADKLIKAMDVGTIYQPDYEPDKREYLEYAKTLDQYKITPVIVRDAIVIPAEWGSMTIRPPQKKNYEKDNDYSLAVSLVYGNTRYLFTGDAQTERLEELKEEGELVHDLLKIPHHGKMDKGLPDFVQAVSPRYAVITCSDKNPPDREVLSLLREQGIDTYLTKDGDIRLTSDGENIRIFQ